MTTATTPRRRSPLPAKLEPENVVVIIDTREQLPVDVSPLTAVRDTLSTADYGLRDLPDEAAIERKSEPDALACIGPERERFDAVVQRMLAYPCRAIVIESTWERFEAGKWRSKVTPAQAIGSLLGWIAKGVPIIMAGDHERAGRYISRILYTAARRRYEEARALAAGILNEDETANRKDEQ